MLSRIFSLLQPFAAKPVAAEPSPSDVCPIYAAADRNEALAKRRHEPSAPYLAIKQTRLHAALRAGVR